MGGGGRYPYLYLLLTTLPGNIIHVCSIIWISNGDYAVRHYHTVDKITPPLGRVSKPVVSATERVYSCRAMRASMERYLDKIFPKPRLFLLCETYLPLVGENRLGILPQRV